MKQFIKLPIMVAESKDIEEFEEAIHEEMKLRELLNKDDSEDDEDFPTLPLKERMMYVNISRVEIFDSSEDGEKTLLLVNDGDIIVNMNIEDFIKLIEKHGC